MFGMSNQEIIQRECPGIPPQGVHLGRGGGGHLPPLDSCMIVQDCMIATWSFLLLMYCYNCFQFSIHYKLPENAPEAVTESKI